MSKFIQIYCKNLRKYIDVEGGDTLADLADCIRDELAFEPICAIVNNKTEYLGFPLFAPKEVEFLSRTTPHGMKVYSRSLCMLLYRAVTALDPSLSIHFEHSVSNGCFCRLFDADHHVVEADAALASRILEQMRSLCARRLPFERREQLSTDVEAIFREQHLKDKAELLATTRELYTTYYVLDGMADSYNGPLAPDTGHINVFNLEPYHGGLLLLEPDEKDPSRPAAAVPQEKMFNAFREQLRFNRVVRVSDVGQLNRTVERGETAPLINVAEAMHDKMLGRISDEIAARQKDGGARIVLMAGPSSSGKTTTSKRLGIQLMTNLIVPKMISLDDYFVDREHTPLDSDGDYDYESLYALDLDHFNDDLRRLLAGEEIQLPTYSFELGRRVDKPRPLRLRDHEVLLIEGIHGLNPELTSTIPAENLFKVYVSALTTLHIDSHNWISTADTRLLRRIVRDYKYRHTSPVETIRRWPSVRRGEEKWIFPFQENADAMFNSSLLFELGVMREFALPLLENVPHNVPEYAVAYRLSRFLSYFAPIRPSQVPATSLLREFLGGSSFRY